MKQYGSDRRTDERTDGGARPVIRPTTTAAQYTKVRDDEVNSEWGGCNERIAAADNLS